MASPLTERRIRAASVHPADRIVVPAEGTDREYIVQVSAVQLAADLGVPLVAVHVARPTAEEPSDDELRDRFAYLIQECENWGVEFDLHIVHGTEVANEIVQELGPRDLVVIGTRSFGGRYHLGGVAETLIRTAPCPVQVVRIE